MRRGLLAWSEAEVPPSVLDARIARCQAATAEAGLGALLIYTSFPRPSAVSYLTHFVPYWSQGVLVVPPEGAPSLFVSLSKRVGGWIEETAHIAEVICTPRLGADIAAFLNDRHAASARIGVLELPRLPGGIAGPLIAALEHADVIDAGGLFRSIRHPADAQELALSKRAADMAGDAFAALGAPASSAPLIAAIDGELRRRGAEEVLVTVAPDLDEDTRLFRPDSDLALGARCAVQISLAYKTHWIRMTETLKRDGSEPARSAFAPIAPTGDPAAALKAALPGGRLRSWRAEANIGSNPLSVIGSDRDPGSGLPTGGVVSLTGVFDGGDGPVLIGGPLFL